MINLTSYSEIQFSSKKNTTVLYIFLSYLWTTILPKAW
jgi:hypothetical protein